MVKQLYHRAELTFWHLVIPQLSPSKPIGRLLQNATRWKRMIPLFKVGAVAFFGGLVGILGGVLIFSLVV